MPIYEYECRACGLRKEILQKVSDPELARCPECGKPKFVKKVSAAGFRLKGTGWYETDFKGKKPADKDKGGEGKTEGGSGDKKDSGLDSGSASTAGKKEGKAVNVPT